MRFFPAGVFAPARVFALADVLALAVVLALAGAAPARGGEGGLDLISSRDEMRENPALENPAAFNIDRTRELLFWEDRYGDGHMTRVVAENERYRLEGGNGHEFFVLGMSKLHPRHVISRPRWELDAGMLLVRFEHRESRFVRDPRDDRDSFVLPSLSGLWRDKGYVIRAVFWREYDILPVNQNYAVILNDNLRLGVDRQMGDSVEMGVMMQDIERRYPDGFILPRRDLGLRASMKNPLGEPNDGLWRLVEGELVQKRYTTMDMAYRELTLRALFRPDGETVKNFITSVLKVSNSLGGYRQGASRDSLVEVVEYGRTGSLGLIYEGFRFLSGGKAILAWGGAWEEPFWDGVRRQRFIHLKLSRLY
ncbi:MAG: hypothetical protein OEZ59_08525 [Deltaproteobacteria bacterium]|nr:hypothetical protein [Deltaproteobacteria bacterium]